MITFLGQVDIRNLLEGHQDNLSRLPHVMEFLANPSITWDRYQTLCFKPTPNTIASPHLFGELQINPENAFCLALGVTKIMDHHNLPYFDTTWHNGCVTTGAHGILTRNMCGIVS